MVDGILGNLSKPPSATVFRRACITTVTPTTQRTLANHVLHVLPSRCSAHVGVIRHLPPTASTSPTWTSPKFLLWPSQFRLPTAHHFGCQPSTISWLVVGYGVKRATFPDVPLTSGGCPLGSRGPVLSVPGLHGPSSRGIMDLGCLPGWESVSFFRTVLPQ